MTRSVNIHYKNYVLKCQCRFFMLLVYYTLNLLPSLWRGALSVVMENKSVYPRSCQCHPFLHPCKHTFQFLLKAVIYLLQHHCIQLGAFFLFLYLSLIFVKITVWAKQRDILLRRGMDDLTGIEGSGKVIGGGEGEVLETKGLQQIEGYWRIFET